MKKILALFTILLAASMVFAQNNVGIGTINPRNSAVLDLSSKNQGLLLPRVDTSFITGLDQLDHGLIVYDTVISQLCVWNGTNFTNAGSNPVTTLPTGNVNVLPLALGSIQFDGTIDAASINVVVNYLSTGVYEIVVSGEILTSQNVVAVSLQRTPGSRTGISYQFLGGNLIVSTEEFQGGGSNTNPIDLAFSFVIHKL